MSNEAVDTSNAGPRVAQASNLITNLMLFPVHLRSLKHLNWNTNLTDELSDFALE